MTLKPPLMLIIFILIMVCFSGCTDIEDTETNGSHGKPLITKDTILEQVVLNGLSLSGNEERVYNYTELVIRGDVDVGGFSKLVIMNCQLIIEQEYNKQYVLSVKDNATFIVDNVYYESKDWRWFNFEYFDNATIKLVDFENENAPWQTIEGAVEAEFLNASAGVTIFAKEDDFDDPFTGSLLINDSESVYFEIDLKPEIDYVFEFPNGYVDEWHPDYFEGSIDVYNSVITNIDIDIWPGVNVTVNNTSPLELGWIFGDGWGQPYSEGNYAEIIGLKNMSYDDYTFEANNARLRLINTSVTGWWPLVTGDFELTVRDCLMIDPWAYNHARFNIYDSYIFYLTATNEAVVEIHNSVVEDSLVALENSTIRLYDTDFSGEMTIEPGARIFIDDVLVN